MIPEENLRDAFLDYLNQHNSFDLAGKIETGGVNEEFTLEWLLGKLWNCNHVLPLDYCEDLNLQKGSTFAQAVRFISTQIK